MSLPQAETTCCGEEREALRSLLLCGEKRKKKSLPREDAEAAEGERGACGTAALSLYYVESCERP